MQQLYSFHPFSHQVLPQPTPSDPGWSAGYRMACHRAVRTQMKTRTITPTLRAGGRVIQRTGPNGRNEMAAITQDGFNKYGANWRNRIEKIIGGDVGPEDAELLLNECAQIADRAVRVQPDNTVFDRAAATPFWGSVVALVWETAGDSAREAADVQDKRGRFLNRATRLLQGCAAAADAVVADENAALRPSRACVADTVTAVADASTVPSPNAAL